MSHHRNVSGVMQPLLSIPGFLSRFRDRDRSCTVKERTVTSEVRVIILGTRFLIAFHELLGRKRYLRGKIHPRDLIRVRRLVKLTCPKRGTYPFYGRVIYHERERERGR